MKCPVCTNVDLLMTERHSVEIDYCPTCRGVWLDRGELDKIRDAVAPTPVATPAQSPAREETRRRDFDDDDDFDDRDERHSSQSSKRRKESLLGNIFDF